MLKKHLFITTLIFLLGSAHASESLDSLRAMVSHSLEALDADTKQWAFTQTTHRKDKIKIEQYTPGMVGDSSWQLLSLNGEVPTEEQLKKYNEQKSTEKKEAESKAAKSSKDDHSVAVKTSDMVKLDTLKVLEENESEWVMSFQPNIADFDAEVNKNLSGRLHLTKNGHYVNRMVMDNIDTLSPYFSVKINKFHLSMEFMKVTDNVLVPKQVETIMSGKALFVKNIEEDSQQSFSNYHLVPPAAAP